MNNSNLVEVTMEIVDTVICRAILRYLANQNAQMKPELVVEVTMETVDTAICRAISEILGKSKRLDEARTCSRSYYENS